MSFGTVRNAINAAFNTAWASATPIAWPNVEFTKPDSAWVRITVDGNVSDQAAFGDGVLHRNSGLIFIQVFTPSNTGSLQADHFSQVAADILQYKRINHVPTGVIIDDWWDYLFVRVDPVNGRQIRTWGATQRTVGNDDGWFQVNVTIPFDYDEVI